MNERKENKSWKRRPFAVVCAVALVCTLSACTPVVIVKSGAQPTTPAVMQPEAPGNSSRSEVQIPAESQNAMTDLLNPVELPDEYFITFEVVKDEQINTVTKGRDKAGNIYFRSAGEELLFISSSDGQYQLYQTDNTAAAPDGSSRVTAKYVEEATAEFTEYAEQSVSRFNGVAAFSGTEEVAGRLCDHYTFDVTVINFTNQYMLAVDQETGVCLRWQKVTGVNGQVTSEDGSFQCTEFSTEQIELPGSF